MPISSPQYKRTTSLQKKPESVIDVADKWKSKGKVDIDITRHKTYDRIYVPASNISRQPEDGCMKKIKLERSLKLR